MKITAVEVFLLHGRFVYVKVSTDEGLSGWGTAAFHGGPVTAEAARRLGAELVGADPLATTAIWDACVHRNYRWVSTGAGAAALAGLDIALHDIKGKALGTPVFNILGGKVRERVAVYSSLMTRGLLPAHDAERVAARVERGFGWVKLHTGTPWDYDAGADETIATVASVRELCGGADRVKLLVDANNGFTVNGAISVGRSLEALAVSHFEEPIAPWDYEGYRRLTAALDLPIAAGEQDFSLGQFRDLVTVAQVDIIQPNVTSCGGYTQAMRIAALAEAYNRPITSHNTDPALGTVAHLHFWAATPMCLYPQEFFGEDTHPLVDDTPVLATPVEVVDGQIAVPDGPGLGVEIDEAAVRRAADA